MNNDNPVQRIGEDYFLFGKPLDPTRPTPVLFPDGKYYVVNPPVDDNITFFPSTGGMDNRNYNAFMGETLSFNDFSTRYPSASNTSTQTSTANFSPITTPVERKDGNVYVYGVKVDGIRAVTFPDGKKYVITGVNGDNITFAPSRGGMDNKAYNSTELQTLSFEELSKNYNPVMKNSSGEITIYGTVAKEGTVVTDKNTGKSYIVQSVDGDNVRLFEATVRGNYVELKGNAIEVNQNGVVQGTSATSDANGTTGANTPETAGANATADPAATPTTDTAAADTTATPTADATATDNQATVSDKAMVAGTEENKKVLEANKNVRSYRDGDGKYVTEESEGANGTTVTSEGT